MSKDRRIWLMIRSCIGRHGLYVDIGCFADIYFDRWTAATLFWAFSQVYEMVFGPKPREWHERLMQECSIFATSLRMPTEMWFTDLDDFWAYWNHNVATLEVGVTSRLSSPHHSFN